MDYKASDKGKLENAIKTNASKKTPMDARLRQSMMEARGQEEFYSYKPWITTNDMIGCKYRVTGNVVNRIYNFYSKLELDVFNILEFSTNVIDIRERVPLLPLEATLPIACDYGVEHPKNHLTNEHTIMTTGFVVTLKTGDTIKTIAREIANQKNLRSLSVIKKYEINRRYWEKQNIDWDLITEQDVNRTLVENISRVRNAFYDYEIEHIDENVWSSLRDAINSSSTIHDLTENIKEIIHDKSIVLVLIKHLIATKQIFVDMKGTQLDFHSNMAIYSVSDDNKGMLYKIKSFELEEREDLRTVFSDATEGHLDIIEALKQAGFLRGLEE